MFFDSSNFGRTYFKIQTLGLAAIAKTAKHAKGTKSNQKKNKTTFNRNLLYKLMFLI
jgi:hypothetical protein